VQSPLASLAGKEYLKDEEDQEDRLANARPERVALTRVAKPDGKADWDRLDIAGV